MKGSQKVGGYAALVQAAAFALALINPIVLLPSLGIDPIAPDPAQLLLVINSPILYVGSLIQFLLTATIVLIALTLYERYGENAPDQMRWAVAAAVISSALFLSAGMVRFFTLQGFAGIPSQHQAGLFVTVNVVTEGLLDAAVFAVGWSFLLSGWAALRTGGLPRILSFVVILGGLSGVLAFVVFLLRPLGALFNLVWSLWLGIMLLREK